MTVCDGRSRATSICPSNDVCPSANRCAVLWGACHQHWWSPALQASAAANSLSQTGPTRPKKVAAKKAPLTRPDVHRDRVTSCRQKKPGLRKVLNHHQLEKRIHHRPAFRGSIFLIHAVANQSSLYRTDEYYYTICFSFASSAFHPDAKGRPRATRPTYCSLDCPRCWRSHGICSSLGLPDYL